MKIILYGICEKGTSTRRLEKLTIENIIFRYLSENLSPNFHTIALFRKDHSSLIKDCFLQTIVFAKKLDMLNFHMLYLDGIKVKANASKTKTFKKEEIDFLSDYIDAYFTQIEKKDSEEDIIYGKVRDGEIKLPEHLTSRRKLKEKMKEMLKDMNRAKKQIQQAKEKLKERNIEQINLTDMDSKLLKMKKGIHFEQVYNCQLLVEDKSEIIVGNHISTSPVDVTETEPTMEKFKRDQNLCLNRTEIFQDNGYSSVKTAEYYEREGVIAYIPDFASTKELHGKAKDIHPFENDAFFLDFEENHVICPAGEIMEFRKKTIIDSKTGNWANTYRTKKCGACVFKKECCTTKRLPYRTAVINPFMRKIRLRFKTKEGVQKYHKRFHKGEVAQAHIFHNLGYREFKCRGKEKCENELNLFSTAYNLIKIHTKITRKEQKEAS